MIPTRLVRNWGASGLDIALVFLGAGDLGTANRQLFFVDDVDTTMRLTKFGRGIFAYARAGPPAAPAQSDGQYRVVVFTPNGGGARGYTLPANAAGQVGNGGENGAPVFVGLPWRIVGTNDMNGDRHTDLLWHNAATGETQMWIMSGTSIVRRATVDADSDGGAATVGLPWRITNH